MWVVAFDPTWPDLTDSAITSSKPVAGRLADEFAEAAAAARHAGDTDLAESLADRVEVFRLAAQRIPSEA